MTRTLQPAHPVAVTGGCQCGAVRYALGAVPSKIGLCHCRMCQKATGAPFGIFAVVGLDAFAWTRGQPARFASSSRAERLFCAACGTPIAFAPTDLPVMEVMVGTLDDPRPFGPTYEVGCESKLVWSAGLSTLPGRTTAVNMGADRAAAVVSHQHPDHDT